MQSLVDEIQNGLDNQTKQIEKLKSEISELKSNHTETASQIQNLSDAVDALKTLMGVTDDTTTES